MSAVNLPNRAALNTQSCPRAAAQLKLLVMFGPLCLMLSGFLQGLKAALLFFFLPSTVLISLLMRLL